MAIGDFHTHSRHSDGVLTPTELIRRAGANGVRSLALTDHDTTAGVAEAQGAGEAIGVRVIPGVELSADLPDGGDAHILGYFPSVEQPILQAQLARYREGRTSRGRAMLAKLSALGMPLRWERVLEIAGEAAVGRPHVAQALVEGGHVGSVREAFDRYLRTGGPADAPREKVPPAEAIALIRESGGVAALAHPSFLPDSDSAVAALTAAGLEGLEVYYKNYTPEEVERFRALADAHGLVPTGGSDYHGIHDDEREPGDFSFAEADVARFLATLEAAWASRRTDATDAMAGA
ncbi:MAG: PHP domain-containing protein [Chloroflexi bacterium]|nr:PHP domain-containing protein [Chloroflexota bacterium]